MNKFLKDSSLNIISNLLVVVAIQLIAFPIISRVANSKEFALLIVLYGIAIVIATSLGNTLNNVRLLHREGFDYKDRENVFSKYFIAILIINIIVFTIICVFYSKTFNLNILLMIIFSLLLTSRYYLNVYFRENLNYKNILFVNLSVLIGYIIGIIIFLFIKLYSVVFLLGEVFGLIYLLRKTVFLKYFSLKRSSFQSENKNILKDYLNFSFINIVINILNYLDRFILLPIIGPVLVNVYFIASTASKMIGLVTTPINNVILSYLTVDNGNKNLKRFIQINIGIIIVSIPMFFIVKYSSLLVVYILYHNYFEKVYLIINLVVLICLLQIFISIFHPFSMRMINSKIILYIQLGYALIYILLAFYGSYIYGIYGFCWSTIISMLLKLLTTNSLVISISMKKGRN
ncbi:hypothetical protein FH103_05650 [Staphylococcus hominis]|uniref:lipopolysaccharide biosynthesis protein n=1 Tax=Staphylococcus TaxID=1279 RepID=UPI0006B98580|nr:MULTISPECIES: hypothetical protein [Staphylococcus]OFM65738.1 hypothetical protein HMPREF2672_10125 [Staphylococcus sp. HMSC068D07]OFN10964.1 hypothetical protein HMPREF2612_02810 [Staphylococcus sp. HMSC058D09]OFR09016.1 hypothetical protein HMPREF2905_04235 [Staphylococcus sp. HMSC078E07]KPG86839.1 hypothetical protein AEQ58_11460 [Staphylococcus hominis]MCI2882137.1 hypothetical protein [Staphylococcus hominis]